MPPFNDNRILTVVRLPSDRGDGTVRLGVRDESTRKVWIEHDLRPTRIHDMDSLSTVTIPSIPPRYGVWVSKFIGGVSKTERREKVICVGSHNRSMPGTLFAIQGKTADGVRNMLAGNELCTVGDTEYDDAEGFVNEVIVHSQSDMTQVAALIARADAIPFLDDSSLDSKRPLGIERLDRINSKVVLDPSTMIEENDGMYGPRRGTENWRFTWIPEGWEAPITWDHMVANVADVKDVKTLPSLLRRHVCEHRLRTGEYPPIGTVWEVSRPQPTPEEVQQTFTTDQPRQSTGIFSYNYGRRVLSDPPDHLVSALSAGVVEFDVPWEGVCPKTLVRATDGTWYNPVDSTRTLKRHLTGKRKVSGALDKLQSRQLMESFYLLTVEKVQDLIVQRAIGLIMFRYMIERGYTARWVGTYKQAGKHVGNGDTFRKFKRLSQYAPHKLPSAVLNKLCTNNGKLQNRGSKGSRSKYKDPNKEHYFPKRRLKRSREDEDAMLRE